MTHVVTQSCCNDASCVRVCPADCIHPGPSEEGFATAEMLWIDPDECIDCGACVEVCPVGAIFPEAEVPAHLETFIEINSMFAHLRRSGPPEGLTGGDAPPAQRGSGSRDVARIIRVAVVGTGPSALFTVDEILRRLGDRARVTIIDELPTAGGLVRFGVAPDHLGAKGAADRFGELATDPRVTVCLNLHLGRHVTAHDVLEHHDAIVLAVGASADRRLQIPGEDLPGSVSARSFLAWCNGHPDHASASFDLSHERAVVVGNGNVALDVARILTADPSRLARMDIADHALQTLTASEVRRVVVLGRRGPADAAFSVPELTGLLSLSGVEVTALGLQDAVVPKPRLPGDLPRSLKIGMCDGLKDRRAGVEERGIELRFFRTPLDICGDDRVEGVTVRVGSGSGAGQVERIECGLVLRSTGSSGVPIQGVPFDARIGRIPHQAGRVIDLATGQPSRGVYVVGWAKRGSRGVIGSNRLDAAETVDSLIDDLSVGALGGSSRPLGEFVDLASRRQPAMIDAAGWRAIEAHETAQPWRGDRPRRKLVSRRDAQRVAAGARSVEQP